EAGIGRGDVVMTMMGARPEWAFTLLGAWRLGAVALPCSEQLRSKDIVLRIEAARPRLVLAAARNLAELEPALDESGGDVQVRNVDADGLPEADHALPDALTEGADPALMIFTS